jgi:tetratricopeptide (TPR) repeat protein
LGRHKPQKWLSFRSAPTALAIDSSDALAYRGRGWLMLVSGKLPEATADLRRSLELNPNDAFTLARLGACESFGGNPVGGLLQCLQALRLSPRDPARFHLLDNLIWAQFSAKAYDDAIDTARQSLREANFAGTRRCLVLCLVGAGELARAASELRELKRLEPEMVAARLGGRWLAGDAVVRQREVDFLHAANTHALL